MRGARQEFEEEASENYQRWCQEEVEVRNSINLVIRISLSGIKRDMHDQGLENREEVHSYRVERRILLPL